MVMAEGAERLGRFLLVRDVDGKRLAIVPTAVLLAAETEDGRTVAILAGGRSLYFNEDLQTVVQWLS